MKRQLGITWKDGEVKGDGPQNGTRNGNASSRRTILFGQMELIYCSCARHVRPAHMKELLASEKLIAPPLVYRGWNHPTKLLVVVLCPAPRVPRPLAGINKAPDFRTSLA